MRAVFSAMRRSLARTRNRLYVLVTRRAQHEPLSLEDGDGNTAFSAVSAQRCFPPGSSHGLLQRNRKGEPASGLPLFEAHLGPPVRLDAGGPRMIHRITGPQPPSSEVPIRKCGPWFSASELNATVDQREQGVVTADTDVTARMPLGAALARDNVPGNDFLTAENLDSQALTAGITAVTRGSACFLMSHRSNLSCPLPIPDS